MKRTKDGHYTFRIDNRTYLFKRHGRGFNVTFITAGGGWVPKGTKRPITSHIKLLAAVNPPLTSR